MAMAVRAAQTAKRWRPAFFLILTMLLGAVFLGIKGFEYYQKYVEHVIPSLDFAPQGEVLARLAPGGLGHAQLFICFYFFMTGLHALHMIIGLGLLFVLLLRALRSEFSAAILRARRSHRPVLALRRYHLDFPLSASLSHRRALLMAAQPIVPVRTYVLVFLALLVLVALTTGAAFIDLGPFNTVIALGIAFLKMMLVLLFFMHLLHSNKLTHVTAVAAAFWLMLLIGLVFADYTSRGWIPDPAPWSSSAPPTHP